MPRRKSLVAQIWAEHQKAVAQREREHRQAVAAELKAKREAEAAAAKAEREEQRRAQQRERDAERRAALRAKEAERKAALKEKELQRAAQMKMREAERRAVQRERDAERRATQRAKEAEARAKAKEREDERKRILAERERERREAERARQAEKKAQERATAAALKKKRELALREEARKRDETRRLKEAKVKAADDLLQEARGLTQGLRMRRDELSGLLASYTPHVGPQVSGSLQLMPETGSRVIDHLKSSEYPEFISGSIDAAFRKEVKEFIIERELPPKTVVSLVKEYRVVRKELRPVPFKPDEVRDLYSQVLSQMAIRTLAEAFDITSPEEVSVIVLNGYVNAIDPATGRETRPCLISVEMSRIFYSSLDVRNAEFDARGCLKKAEALISEHPHDLVPVVPVLAYDLDRYKIIAGMDVVIDLDSRLDLLSLKPFEFENLVKRLFAARGLRAWQTQESNDDGIDAVVVNEDPITGGVVVVQAKRFTPVVSYESVTALAGVMHDKKAVRGILVTTSWVGAKGHKFAQGNRIQIIEARELKQQLREYLNMDVLVSLPNIPRTWKRSEVA